MKHVDKEVHMVMGLLDSATNINDVETDGTWSYVIEAAYKLNELIRSHQKEVEHWLEWWFLLESECMPVTMEEYVQDMLKEIKKRQRYQKFIEEG